MKKRNVFCTLVSTVLCLSICLCCTSAAYANNEDSSASRYEKIEKNKYSLTEYRTETDLTSAAKKDVQTASNSRSALPASYSSVEQGYVTPIKDQGARPTCWSFSALATFESLLYKRGAGVFDFSEEHLIAFETTQDKNGFGWQLSEDMGGVPEIPMGYLTSWTGPILESDMPYTAFGSKLTDVGKTEYGVTDIVYLYGDDHESIKQAIMDYGAVDSTYSNKSGWNLDSTAFFCKSVFPEDTFLDGHAISIVGWDDNYSRTNFRAVSRPAKNGAWLVKNSWGNYNSLNGYFWISYEDVYLFDSVFSYTYAIADYVEIQDNSKIYQTETHGSTYNFAITDDGNEVTSLTYANVYDFRHDNYLDKVVFNTLSTGADYKVYYSPAKSGTPSKNKNTWTLLKSGTVDHDGYISADIDDYRLPSGKGAIIVELDGRKKDVMAAFGCNEWWTTMDGEFYYIPPATKDVSYLYIDNNFVELMDFYKSEFDDDIGSSFVIKAITTYEYYKGDANTDGLVNMRDILHMQKHVARFLSLTNDEKGRCDLNNDGTISMVDILLLQKAIAGIITIN